LREAEARAQHRRAEEQLRESHEQLRALSVYLQTIREEERTRIAREVHDELGQALTSCKLDLSWIAGHLPHELKPLVDKARALSSHIDSTIQTVRRISTELRPGVLDHLGLGAALEWQANEFQNRTGIRCDVFAEIGELQIEQNLSTTLFRIFQETLTNVIRHAGATHVTVHLKEAGGRIYLDVKDNGRGISRKESTKAGSMGLLGMRERAALLGGIFRIGRLSRGKGTQVSVSIPLLAPATGEDENNSGAERSKPTMSTASEAESEAGRESSASRQTGRKHNLPGKLLRLVNRKRPGRARARASSKAVLAA
jgi:signal transduction histidine kinase